jgi:4-phytase/acid phosphatase
MKSFPISAAVFALSALLGLEPAAAAASYTMERVVFVQRHGVRSPTKTPEALRAWSDKAWPQWPVGVADLTPHGAEGVALVVRSIRADAVAHGLLAASGCADSQSIRVWADGGDQRTRESGAVIAQTLGPGCKLIADFRQDGANDPTFDGLGGACLLDPIEGRTALLKAAGPTGLIDATTRNALGTIQDIMAPKACSGGEGECLSRPTDFKVNPDGIKLQGPLATASTASEIFLLEYAQGFDQDRVGWGRAFSAEILRDVLAAHERASDLTRRLPYVAARRAGRLSTQIISALKGEPGQPGAPWPASPAPKVLAFAGHDTNIANLSGVFGLQWDLADQPDTTAPATALSFELWRDQTGEEFVKPRLWYGALEQLRNLSPRGARHQDLNFSICKPNADGMCRLRDIAAHVDQIVPPGCKP